MVREAGYKDLTTYYICLRENPTCKICGSKGTIPYYYLSIKNKVQMFCSDAKFCVKMTAHWEEKEHWLNRTGGWMPRKEIWDGLQVHCSSIPY